MVPGPQTRSRANVATATEKEATPGGKATEKVAVSAEKEVTSSTCSKPLKPTCSKLLKKANASDSEGPGTVARYLQLRERQKLGIPPPTIENLPEMDLENIAEEETEPGILLQNITSTGLNYTYEQNSIIVLIKNIVKKLHLLQFLPNILIRIF